METYLPPSQQEMAQHGDKLSPFALYHCLFAVNVSQVLPHWHEEAEFTIIREGQATYQIGQETFHVGKGDLLFIAPNTLHSIYLESKKSMISDTLVFHLDMVGYSNMDQCSISFLRPFYNGTLKLTPYMNHTCPYYNEIYDSIDSALYCVNERPPYYEFLLREKINHLFFLMFKHNCLTETKISKSAVVRMEKVKQALLFIQENYKEPITISQLAKLCNFSEIHFMNFFKKVVGIPCMEYIIQLRLKIAADLIISTNFLISEIALECGFGNLSNFNRKFKANFQVTPMEYRKKYP